MQLTAGDFADLTARVAGLARPGRLALFLEGGYDLPALRKSVGACAARLVGAAYRSRTGLVRGGRAGAGHQVSFPVGRRSAGDSMTSERQAESWSESTALKTPSGP